MKRFPPFALDLQNQCLWKGDEKVALMPKPFAVLRHLVEHAGRLVTPGELLTAVWPDTFVQPEVLRKHILEIRRVLDDRANDPRFVQTLPKRGYTFVAAVTNDVDSGSRFQVPGSAPELPGRAEASRLLLESLSAALAGRRRLVFVTGEAGIGKTTVVDAFQQSANLDHRFTVLRGQAVEGFAGKEPYYPILEALGQAARGPGAAALRAVLDSYAPTWLLQLPGLASAERRRALMIELAGATRERMVRELCEALEVWSESQPLLLVLEDLHWADRSTIDVLSAVARRRQPARLVVAATYRPVDLIISESPLKTLKQDLLLHSLCHELALERLERDDVRGYLAAEYGPGVPSTFAEAIHRQSDGNPLFMTTLLAHLVARGILIRTSGGWILTVDPARLELDVPDTLKQMLQAEIERLTPDDQETLKAASVQGTIFDAGAVAAMRELEAIDIEHGCARLAERGQVIRPAAAPGGGSGFSRTSYEFRHALYRDLLYRRLSPGHRVERHQRLGALLEARAAAGCEPCATELAEHFEKGREFRAAVRYLADAARVAAQRVAHGDAIAFAEHGLTLLSRLPEADRAAAEHDLTMAVGAAAYAVGDAGRSAAAYARAAASAERMHQPARQADALFRLAGPTALFDPDAAIAVCERAAALGRQAALPVVDLRGRFLAACWRILFHGWTREDSQTWREAAASIGAYGADRLPAHDLMLQAHVQFIESDYAEAAASAQAGLAALSEADGLWERVAGTTAESVACMYLGEYGTAYRRLQDGLDLARKNGNLPWQGILMGVVASVHLHVSDFAGTRAITNQLLAGMGGERLFQVSTELLFMRGFAELWSGDVDRAELSFRESLAEGHGTVFPLHWYFRIFARLGLASVHLARGHMAEATREAGQLNTLAATCQDRMVQVLVAEFMARCALASGAIADARRHIDDGLAVLAAFEVPMVAWRTYDTAREIDERAGDPAGAERHRRRAAQVIERISASLEGFESLRATLLADPQVRGILA